MFPESVVNDPYTGDSCINCAILRNRLYKTVLKVQLRNTRHNAFLKIKKKYEFNYHHHVIK